MRMFGLEIKRADATPISSRGWWPIVREPYTGAWQRNDEWTADTVLAYHAVYACITLIANDIGKLREKLVEKDSDGIWNEIQSAAYSPVLRRPNRYQNHIQFKQWWITSKLIRGNAYALKQRDNRGVVTALYLLDPSRVQTLVSPDGSVFYQLSSDNLAGVQNDDVQVPASEIIHDRMNCLFHPLVGVSPLFAAGQGAMIGLNIEKNSSNFFGNGSNPSGVLTAPGAISQDTAERIKTGWATNYGGENSGKVAVLGDGLKFEPMRMSAVDSQMIEQLRWTAEIVCSVFHVPIHKIGLGAAQPLNNIEVLQQDYYNTCLQSLIEEYEACKDDGLGLDGETRGIELDLDGLIRMDTAAQVAVLSSEITAGLATIDEGRFVRGRKPVEGGDSVWMQQQDTSLAALAERDRNPPQLALPAPPPEPAPPVPDPDTTEDASKWLRSGFWNKSATMKATA